MLSVPTKDLHFQLRKYFVKTTLKAHNILQLIRHYLKETGGKSQQSEAPKHREKQ